jgi:hypothetical protein
MVYDQMFFKIMMEALGAFERHTYEYIAMFRLEWPDSLVAEQKHTWEGVINEKLPEALDGFHKYAIPLRGTDKSKAQVAEEVVRTLWPITQAPDDDGGAVPESGPDGESQEHQAE